MARITLRGIKRRGLVNWKGREWWLSQNVRIWSREHRAWWRDGANGYTVNMTEAGIFPFADAYERTKHCGPEKQIAFDTAR